MYAFGILHTLLGQHFWRSGMNVELTRKQILLMFKQVEKFRVVDYRKKVEKDNRVKEVQEVMT
jgi:hypothetical protein